MNYREAFSEAVQGERVTCDRLGEGVYIDYQFNGLRINHPHGGSSGFTPRDADIAAEWRVVLLEPPTRPAPAPAGNAWGSWGKPTPAAPHVGTVPPVDDVIIIGEEPSKPEASKWGKWGS